MKKIALFLIFSIFFLTLKNISFAQDCGSNNLNFQAGTNNNSNFNCNNNSNENTNSNSQSQSQEQDNNQNVNISLASYSPVVYAAQKVTQLPSTGTPWQDLAIIGMAPLGFIFKKFLI